MTKNTRIDLRCSRKFKEDVRQFSSNLGMSISEYVSYCVYKCAAEVYKTPYSLPKISEASVHETDRSKNN